MISILCACNEKREREKLYNDDEGGQGGKQLSESERHLHFLIIFFHSVKYFKRSCNEILMSHGTVKRGRIKAFSFAS